MTRISAGSIIARSYGFAFGGFRVLGIIWLPLAIEFCAAYFLLTPFLSAIGQMFAHLPASGDASGMPQEIEQAMQDIYRYALLLMLAGLFLRSVMMLGITQEALGMRQGTTFVFFAIGKDVWRLFGAYFIFQIIIQIAVIALMFIVIIPAVLVGVVGAIVVTAAHLPLPVVQGLTVVAVVAAAILIYGLIFWFVIRLGFLFTPVVVIEKKIEIARIWNLSKGNAWPMFLICVAIFVPVFLVYAAIMLVIFLHAAIPVFTPLSHHPNSEDVKAHLIAFFHIILGAWFVILPVAIIFATLFYGLAGSAMAFAYQALVPVPKPGDVDSVS